MDSRTPTTELTFERAGPVGGRRAAVLHPYLKADLGQGGAIRTPEARLEECVGLALAIRLDVLVRAAIPLSTIRPGSYLGPGKIEELRQRFEDLEIEVAVFDCALSPVQQRNLEKALCVKVIDRTGLILEIFGERARTREGALQVELAHLTYQKSRLVRSWTHLERQRGGFGFMGGPGETQIEADRRLIDERISRIKKDLEQVVRTRGLHRKARRKVPFPVVALVGYTNAGKSTLFNRLTKANVMAEDLLFATLDPTMREVALPSGAKIILSDTVGFISELPTHLIAAFRATLEEVLEANLILHVRDVSHPDSEAQKRDVLSVLADLGIEPRPERPIIEVLNKIDLLDEAARHAVLNQTIRQSNAIAISAVSGAHCDDLLAAIDAQLLAGHETVELDVANDDGALISWLYAHGEVLNREDGESGVRLSVRLSPENHQRLDKRLHRDLTLADPGHV